MLQTLFFRSREQGAAVLGAQEQVCIYKHDQYLPCFQLTKWWYHQICACMQLNLLAAENATLKAKLTEREQAAQLEIQDLRKFCIASQEKDSERDREAYKELHEQQQQMMSRLSTVESVASQAGDSAQRILLRLDQVI